jgi:hypothetical protein
MTAHYVLSALADIREGRVTLAPAQQAEFLKAVEELARVMLDAPRGGDAVQIAIWHRHERTPALARLADAARPGEPSMLAELESARREEMELLRELQAQIAAVGY